LPPWSLPRQTARSSPAADGARAGSSMIFRPSALKIESETAARAESPLTVMRVSGLKGFGAADKTTLPWAWGRSRDRVEPLPSANVWLSPYTTSVKAVCAHKTRKTAMNLFIIIIFLFNGF
jgi:hypothetical protein